MASNSWKLIFPFSLVSSLNFVTTEAQNLNYINQSCSSNRTTDNSAFQSVLRTLLATLSSNANNTEFYNNTVACTNSSETVHGLFLCRGDVLPQVCGQCVLNATQTLSSNCSLSNQAVIWYDECMVRYSIGSFFSTVDTQPRLSWFNVYNAPDKERFMHLLFLTMNKTADEAARPHIGVKKYAIKQVNMPGFRTLYCLAQCTPDLSHQDCRSCLSGVIGDLRCCARKQGGRVLCPSCNVRYEWYPFYRFTAAGP